MPLGGNTSTTEQTTPSQTAETTSVVEEVAEEEEVLNIPDITLVVENGTGLPDANSYCDLDYAVEYCTMKGYTDWLKLSENQQKIFIIRGTEFVDNFYTWKGIRHRQSQSMAFPRDDIYDDDRYPVDGIPDKLKKACIEAAFLNASSSANTLFSTKDENGKVKKQKVDTLEVEYFNAEQSGLSATDVDYKTIYDILNKLLKGLYKTGDDANHVCTRAIWEY